MKRGSLLCTAALLAAFAGPSGLSAQASVKYVKYEIAGRVAWGILESDTTIREISGSPIATAARPVDTRVEVVDVRFLPPADPNKVIAAGLNYRSHIGDASPAAYVGLFAKFPSTLVGHGADIVYPADATSVHYEAEICVVIGKTARNISEAQAREHVFGVTACNDVSERGWQKADLQWLRAKGTDTFGPIGPALVTNVDYNRLKLIGRLNGQVVQESTSDLLIFPIDNIVSYISRYVTLEPGDVIFTGTPGTTQALKPGDTFEVEIPGVTLLRNKVVAAPARF